MKWYWAILVGRQTNYVRSTRELNGRWIAAKWSTIEVIEFDECAITLMSIGVTFDGMKWMVVPKLQLIEASHLNSKRCFSIISTFSVFTNAINLAGDIHFVCVCAHGINGKPNNIGYNYFRFVRQLGWLELVKSMHATNNYLPAWLFSIRWEMPFFDAWKITLSTFLFIFSVNHFYGQDLDYRKKYGVLVGNVIFGLIFPLCLTSNAS